MFTCGTFLKPVRPVPKSQLTGIVVALLLQAGCPSYRTTNRVKIQKQHAAT